MWLEFLLLCVFGFTCSLTTSFDLGGVISGNRMAGVPLGRSLGEGTLDVEGVCREAGMACQNCTHAVTCIPLPVGWLKVPLQECAGDTTCNVHLGTCSTQHVPECDPYVQQYQHSCEQVGIFPDAVDCRKFHLCSPPDGFPEGRPADHREAHCPRHYGYNPQIAQCSIQLYKGQCTNKPVPTCTEIGETGVVPSSLNHYYVCLSKQGQIQPQIFICPNGWYFWEGFCRQTPPVEKVTEGTETTTEYSTTVDKETKEDQVTSAIDSFFSTEKSSTYAPDTFLADKFDLANYEATDDAGPSNDVFFSDSSENTSDFW
ncbi:uncharacterized protein LOC106140628 [Amyelois transitella]|uniref:uncharacterized protein LOC106140628 n=1 Tax=Amyelois transitella TaxID=680683 RepID=UPI00067B07CA|nr:uncharacterized protein LOC106140628 [Amyelois transitella]